MSAQKKGYEYENELCKDIYDATDGALIPEPIGFSGNHSLPAPDIRIDDGTKVHAIELKRTTKDRISIGWDPESTKKDDLHQLIAYARDYPRTVVPYVGVRFTNRQLLLSKLWLGAPNEEAVVRSATNLAETDIRFTGSKNLSVHRPSLDDWKSATSGDDAAYLLETIGWK